MAENTFLGLQPYTEADAYRFKGRSEESQDLFRLIIRNDYTVCYAESGEGKTSLLNAGVFPLLRQNMYFPIAITFTSDDYKRTPDSFDTIIDRCIKDSIDDYNEKNKGINIEYRLCSTDFQNLDYQLELQQRLSKHSWWKLRNYKPQAMGLTFTPVFVFDQFEEVFNMPISIVWTNNFFKWLEDVSADSCPDKIVNVVREIIGSNAAFPAIKENKDFKAVFSLRKEFIGELDYWGMQKCFIPSLKDNRYCLKALTYEGAKKVMTQQQRFEESKVEQVLRYFVQQYSHEQEKTIEENLPVIPALLLSVVCDSWEKDIYIFSGKDIYEIGQSLTMILERFYDEALSSITNELLLQKDNGKVKLIREDIETAIFALIDNNGKRVRRKSTELSNLNFDAKYKKILSGKRIVKISKVDGEDYVEIVHDALCPIIAKRKELIFLTLAKKREEERLCEQTRKMRKRMLLIGLFFIAIFGFILVIWGQQKETNNERKAKMMLKKQRDEMALLNRSLKEQIKVNKLQKDSLNNQLFINEEQKKQLEHSLANQSKLSQSLKMKNDSLVNQVLLNENKRQIIDKLNEELKSQNLSLQEQLKTIKNQEAKIKKQDEILKGYSTLLTTCLSIRSAMENGSASELRLANTALKNCEAKAHFETLRCLDDYTLSLDGHFVYDEAFIDELLGERRLVYRRASVYVAERKSRDNLTGTALMVNKAVKKSSSSKYEFYSKGHQELAVITEPGGMITLRIHVTNKYGLDVRFDDTKDIIKGQPYRVTSLDLPNHVNKVELEIINCSKRDISFVILSN